MVCKIEKGELTQRCEALDDSLNLEANAKQKGLCLVVTAKIPEFENKVRGVAYRTSSKDKGVMLNFCPWCGTNIRPR